MKRDARAVKEGLLLQLPQVIQALFGSSAVRSGHEWRLGSTTGERGNSVAIEAQDPVRLGLWMDHNPAAAGKKEGDVLELIAEARGVDLSDALRWGRDFLGWTDTPQTPFTAPRTGAGVPLAPAHPRSLERSARALLAHPAALAYLEGRGLTRTTITHFHLGLNSYPGQAGEVRDALSYPLLDTEGVPRKRWLRSRIPGVTQGVDEKRKDWAGGKPGTYWVTPASGRRNLLVCEGAKDGWWLWQALQESPLATELSVITSTHGSAVPEEWKDPRFWQPWDVVYLAQDADAAGDAMALRVKRIATRDVQRVRVPEGRGKDWTDFFSQGGTLEQFIELCQQAPLMSEDLEATPAPGEVPPRPGLYAATPVNVSSAFVNGHLYVPFRVLERSVEEGERLVQRYRTYVLRSDGKVCTFDFLPAPKNTPREDLVLALDDGTVISKAPMLDEARATFSLAAITRFRDARLAGQSALSGAPGALLEGVHAHLKRSVVLPHPEDYALLTFVAAVSYVQQIFDAVPLVLIVGTAGSGKTDLARALAQVGCNATIITGQTSAATAARVLDQLSGLAVFDDLEQIGQRSAGDEFSEFVQQLKVSYKKDTARKAWTNTKTMRVETLDFYGVKIITNTTGADEILSSRMLKVFTRKLPPEVLGEIERTESTSGVELQELRDGLHLWAMENVGTIDALYRQRYAAHTGRQQEIEAPLRVLAELFGHALLRADLEQALRLQGRADAEVESASGLLKLAAQELVRQGYWDRVSVKQLLLQMRLLVGEDWGKRSTTEIPEWQEPRWVGKVLRVEYIVDPRGKDERPRLWGEQTRVYPLDSGFVAETLNSLREAGIPHADKVRQPLEFCEPQPCAECLYASFCDMLTAKQEHLRRKGKRPQA